MCKTSFKISRFGKWLISLLITEDEFEYALGDMEEICHDILKQKGRIRARLWFWTHLFFSLPGFIKNRIVWSMIMFNNYIKTALRNLKKYRVFSSINIMGLAIGIACCLIIILYVHHELSYDRFVKDHQLVYRVAEDIRTKTANRVFAPISLPAAPALKKDFPQVKYAGRLMDLRSRLVKYKDKIYFEEKGFIADQDILHIFSIPFIKGNPDKALLRPNTVVLTDKMARKYFGQSDPRGQMLKIDTREYEITGVCVDPPENTHWKYTYLISLKTFQKWGELKNWYNTMGYTYIKVTPKTQIEDLKKQVTGLANPYIGERLKKIGEVYHYFLQPLASIHLYSHIRYEIEPPGNPQSVVIFMILGILILLIACINFINITTARSFSRAKEVGLRKTMGSRRVQLIAQFLGETYTQSVMALLLAILITILSLPLLQRILGLSLSVSSLTQLPVLLMLAVLLLVTGFAAGIFPAFVLARFNPIIILKGLIQSGNSKSILRNFLVLVQFSIAILLVICSLVVKMQLDFMQNQRLGFDKEQKLVVPIRGGIKLENRYEMVKDAFLKNPPISAASFSSSLPGRGVSNFNIRIVGETEDKSQSMFHLHFDADFITQYKIRMIAGRSFNKKMATDVAKTFLINKAAVKAFGWNSPQEALGKILKTGYGGRDGKIIGVTEDFHYRGLQVAVEPLVMEWYPPSFRTLSLTVSATGLPEILKQVKKTWATLFPGFPFQYSFLDEDFGKLYQSEERTGYLVSIFSILGQIIACLGLFGLAAFTAQQRTREIGIRKVVGASTLRIMLLLGKDMLSWVILANVLAWPMAYLASKNWLSHFAYRTSVGPGVYIFAGLLATAIAILTVSFHSFKASQANPVSSLRYE